MRLKSVSFRGLTRFTSGEPVSVDFDTLGPGLIALVGPNGAGKTTVMEAVAAALYKKLPSRPGSLYEHAHGRDAFVEATFEEGFLDGTHEIKARVQIDADLRKIESYLFQGGQALTTGRALEFEATVERLFGTYELFLSSVFNAQNRAGSFLLMPKAERKALFVELLGLDYLERLHIQARENAVEAEGQLRTARALLAQAQVETAGLEDAEGKLGTAAEEERQAGLKHYAARQAEAEALQRLEQAKAAEERIFALRDAAHTAHAALQRAEQDLKAAEALAPAARAEADHQRYLLDSRDIGATEERARGRHAATVANLKKRQDALGALIDGAPAIRDAVREAEAMRGEAELLRAAEKVVADLVGEKKLAEVRYDNAVAALGNAEAHHQQNLLRLGRQAGLLAEAPCTAAPKWTKEPLADMGRDREGVDLAGTCPLLSDARNAKAEFARLSDSWPSDDERTKAQMELAQIERATEEATLACDPIRLAEIDALFPGVRDIAGKAEALEHAEEQAKAVEQELSQADVDLKRDLAAVDREREKVQAMRAEIGERLRLALVEADTVKVPAALDALEVARAKGREALDALEAAEKNLLSETSAVLAHGDAQEAVREAETAYRTATQTTATLTAKVERLREVQANAARLEAEAGAVETELGDWNLLAKALGRDGVQALEIDAAGPEVARLVNELLASCYGARFSISFETLREKKSKAGEYAEAFDVKVYDQGRERPVEALSGGERVVVGEAVGLAISIFNARKSGVRWETLFRDETAGALDPANAQAYVEMLRRALGLGGFHQVLFVSHQPEVWERADVRLLVADGRVTPEGAQQAASMASPVGLEAN